MTKSNSNADTLTGLSEAEVAVRLQQHGFNELPSSKSRSIFATAWEVVREPMFLLLLACGTIYLVLGDVQEPVHRRIITYRRVRPRQKCGLGRRS